MPQHSETQAWQLITEPYLHGYERSKGDRKARIVRHYGGEWHVWASLKDGAVTIDNAEIGKAHKHWKQAQAAANKWLSHAREVC